MSHIVLGDCLTVLPTLLNGAVDFVLTDPPYLVDYQDRSGRRIANDKDDRWLTPAFRQIYRILRDDAFCVSFYGWTRVDRFFSAWRIAGFRVVGHIVFAKQYQSNARFLRYQHESAYLLAEGHPALPNEPLPAQHHACEWALCHAGRRHGLRLGAVEASNRTAAWTATECSGSWILGDLDYRQAARRLHIVEAAQQVQSSRSQAWRIGDNARNSHLCARIWIALATHLSLPSC